MLAALALLPLGLFGIGERPTGSAASTPPKSGAASPAEIESFVHGSFRAAEPSKREKARGTGKRGR